MPSEITKGALAAEADLVTRARRRDEDAVRAIIGQNNRRLFRLARSIVKDDNEAETSFKSATCAPSPGSASSAAKRG
jgi:hypothetical protein